MFAILKKGQYVAAPLPKWTGPVSAAPLSEFAAILRRHAPLTAFPPHNDDGYCLVSMKDLAEAIAYTLHTLEKQGVRYTKNAWDCEDFVNELHQTLRKMAAVAGIEFAPITCVIAVRLVNEWAGVKPTGNHALACVMTDAGAVVVESQNGQRISFESYPNRTSLYSVNNL